MREADARCRRVERGESALPGSRTTATRAPVRTLRRPRGHTTAVLPPYQVGATARIVESGAWWCLQVRTTYCNVSSPEEDPLTSHTHMALAR